MSHKYVSIPAYLMGAPDPDQQWINAQLDRIAQACLVPVPSVEFEVVEQLSITERGAGGFGHTGAA